MSKIDGKTLNIEQENINKIKKIFPEVNTDGKIDFDVLKQLLGDYVEDSDERYKFTWNGKGEALRISQIPSIGTLRPDRESSKNFDSTENLYIEGDNLEVLKLLQKSYFGKVDVIYIDPPYNTGQEFVYKDDYRDNIENYKKLTGQMDDEGAKISTNYESSGRYHTDWINMMYPRLRLAKNLLSEKGAIFISIDDNEMSNLKKISDEIFGENNFLASFIINKTAQGANQSATFKLQHEYCLAYTKNLNSSDINSDINIEIDKNKFKHKDEKGYYAITNKFDSINSPLSKNRNRGYTVYYNIQTKNIILRDEYDQNTLKFKKTDEKLLKDGYVPIRPSVRKGVQYPWNWIKERFLKEYKDELVIRKDSTGNYSIYHKNRFTGKNKDTTLKTFDTRQQGNQLLNDLLEIKAFDYPKSLDFMVWIITKINYNNALVLDFFSGSATTAHASMKLNAEDGGNRKFIMVQLPELIDKNSEAYEAGYENIAEIGKERIRRAGDQIKSELKEKYKSASYEERKNMKNPDDLDIGFRTFKLDNSNIKAWNPGEYDNIQMALEDSIDPYVEGRSEEDVVYEMILKMGLDLTLPIDNYVVNNKTIYSVGFGLLMICLADDIDFDVTNKMIDIKNKYNQEEFRVIFRDAGFRSDKDKTNIKETLKSAGLAEESFNTL